MGFQASDKNQWNFKPSSTTLRNNMINQGKCGKMCMWRIFLQIDIALLLAHSKWIIQWVALKVHSVLYETNKHDSGKVTLVVVCIAAVRKWNVTVRIMRYSVWK